MCMASAPLLQHRVASGDWRLVSRDPEQPPHQPDKPGLLSLLIGSALELTLG